MTKFGMIGQSMSVIVPSGSPVSITTGATTDIITLSAVPAGSWLIWGNVTFIPQVAGTITSISAWSSDTSTTQPDSSLYAQEFYNSEVPNMPVTINIPMRVYEITPAGNTINIFLSVKAVFTGLMTTCGGIYGMEFA